MARRTQVGFFFGSFSTKMVKPTFRQGDGSSIGMSVLGHKQTFCGARAMSALPPKADMCRPHANEPSASYRSEIGVSPAFKITGAASGDARKRISALAASGCSTVTGERTREESHWLDLGRNCADEGNSRDVYQFADLLEADLRLATRDDRGHRLAGRRPSHFSALARDLVCDAELGEQRGR